MTGVNFLINALVAKQFKVLQETVPKTTLIGFLDSERVSACLKHANTDHRRTKALGTKRIFAKA